jgi:hypothetical protein
MVILRMSDLPPPVPSALLPHLVLTAVVESEIEALEDLALARLEDVEDQIDRLCAERAELLGRLTACRDARHSTVAQIYKWPKQPLPIDPDAMPSGRPVRGPELRAALTEFIVRAQRPLGVNELRRLLAAHGLQVEGDAKKTVANALRWEVAANRVVKRARGLWAAPDRPGSIAPCPASSTPI